MDTVPKSTGHMCLKSLKCVRQVSEFYLRLKRGWLKGPPAPNGPALKPDIVLTSCPGKSPRSIVSPRLALKKINAQITLILAGEMWADYNWYRRWDYAQTFSVKAYYAFIKTSHDWLKARFGPYLIAAAAHYNRGNPKVYFMVLTIDPQGRPLAKQIGGPGLYYIRLIKQYSAYLEKRLGFGAHLVFGVGPERLDGVLKVDHTIRFQDIKDYGETLLEGENNNFIPRFLDELPPPPENIETPSRSFKFNFFGFKKREPERLEENLPKSEEENDDSSLPLKVKASDPLAADIYYTKCLNEFSRKAYRRLSVYDVENEDLRDKLIKLKTTKHYWDLTRPLTGALMAKSREFFFPIIPSSSKENKDSGPNQSSRINPDVAAEVMFEGLSNDFSVRKDRLTPELIKRLPEILASNSFVLTSPQAPPLREGKYRNMALPEKENWPRVFRWLTKERKLDKLVLLYLYQKGLIYVSKSFQLVFPCQGGHGAFYLIWGPEEPQDDIWVYPKRAGGLTYLLKGSSNKIIQAINPLEAIKIKTLSFKDSIAFIWPNS
ncbi:MAG: plasmid recombination protein [Deltaproteobacteria bacterium]|nr:plasmid recombination protein [Deltaproteobacteria bacterium]